MSFCCKHTKKASELITEAFNEIIGKSDKEPSSKGEFIRSFFPYASLYDKSCLHDAIKDYEEWMTHAKEFLKKAQEEANNCKCTEVEKERVLHLNQRIMDKDELIKFGSETLIRTTNRLERTEEKVSNLEKVKDQFSELKKENDLLREQLTQLKEENLTYKLEKLERLIFRLGIDEDKIKNLRNSYENLFRAQKNNEERDNIRKLQNDIEIIEKNLRKVFLRLEIDLEEVQRIFGMCKEVARLQVQLEQTQEQHQQYKALIMVPFRQN